MNLASRGHEKTPATQVGCISRETRKFWGMAGGGESQRHWRLKQAALAWLADNQYPVRATEIRLPNGNYRADVVGYRPEKLHGSSKGPRKHQIGLSAILECKQARSDFLKDSRQHADTVERLRHWQGRRATLERLLNVHHPSLRKGETLFSEYDSVDMTALQHRTYQRVQREIRGLQNRLHHGTKFEKMIRYHCANFCYLVAFPGLVQKHELPDGWGLMELASVEENETLIEVQKPRLIEVPEHRRLELLHLIAIASTSRWNRELGLEVSWKDRRPSEPIQAPKGDAKS